MLKKLMLVAVAFMAVGLMGKAFAEPLTAEACKAKAIEAAKLVEAEGPAAFDKIKDPAGPFSFGDGSGYVWIHDSDNMMVMHPKKPELNGKPIADMRDVNGVYFFVSMTDIATEKGAGWVAYAWPKPGKTDSSPKVSYVVKAVNGGKTYIVGSGIYDITAADIKAKFPADPIAE
ncbi:MAG: cache domain-containing protein [Candidatus Omnitrophica bacterium]|nr:cache domain-containing protein [Candidatus Omnitrophota bacterium]